MAIVVSCRCGQRFQARDEWAGRRTKCPSCGADLVIPAKAAQPGAASPGQPGASSPAGKPHQPGTPGAGRAAGTGAAGAPGGERELTVEEMLKLARSMETLAGTGEVQPQRPAQPLGFSASMSPGAARSATAPKRGGKGLLIGGLAGGAVLAVVIAAVVYFAFLRPPAKPSDNAANTQVAANTRPAGTTPKTEEPKPAEPKKQPEKPPVRETSDTQKPEPPKEKQENPPVETQPSPPAATDPEEPPSPIPAADSVNAVRFFIDQLGFHANEPSVGQPDTKWQAFDGDGYKCSFPGVPRDEIRWPRTEPNRLAGFVVRSAVLRHDKWGMVFAVCHTSLEESDAAQVIDKLVTFVTEGATSVDRSVTLDEDGGVRATAEHVRNGVMTTTSLRCVASSNTTYLVLVGAAKANYSVPRAKKFIESFQITAPRTLQVYTFKELGFSIEGPGKPIVTQERGGARGRISITEHRFTFLDFNNHTLSMHCWIFPRDYPMGPQPWLRAVMQGFRVGQASRKRTITLGAFKGEEVSWHSAKREGQQLVDVRRAFAVGDKVYLIELRNAPEEIPADYRRFLDSLRILPEAAERAANEPYPWDEPRTWQSFTSKECGFSVEGPGKPFKEEYGGIERFMFHNDNGDQFIVECIETGGEPPEKSLKEHLNLKLQGEKPKQRRSLTVGGVRGEEIVIQEFDEAQFTQIFRIFATTTRVYLVYPEGYVPATKAGAVRLSADAKRFFDSFKVLDEAPKK